MASIATYKIVEIVPWNDETLLDFFLPRSFHPAIDDTLCITVMGPQTFIECTVVLTLCSPCRVGLLF
jgi:hypothetical protein